MLLDPWLWKMGLTGTFCDVKAAVSSIIIEGTIGFGMPDAVPRRQ